MKILSGVLLIIVLGGACIGLHAAERGTRAGGPYLILPEGGNMLIYGTGTEYFILDREKYLGAEILKNFEKLSSGLRIVRPSDDPSGFAVAEKLKAVILEVQRRSLNEQDMKNYLNYVDSALSHDSALLSRIRILSVQASNGILGKDDRELIQTEVSQLLREIDANAENAEFNTKKVIPGLTAQSLGVKDINVAVDPASCIKAADAAMTTILKMRSGVGASANILEFRIRGRSFYYVNLQAAESRIRDLDMAEEISALLKNRTLIKADYGLIIMGMGMRR
jgi:flagellin